MFPDITCDDIFRLETARLWLRWLRAADSAAIRAFASLASVAQMTASIPHPYPPGEAERFILNARAATSAGAALILAVTLKNKGQSVIGIVSAQSIDAREIEIGYALSPASAGRGYATEALSTLVDAVFNLTEARSISANSRVGNPASRRVLEKSGFAYLRTDMKMLPARGGQHPCDFFGLDRHQWSSQAKVRRLPAMAHQKVLEWPRVVGERAE